MSLKFNFIIISGPEAKSIASIHYPPFWDLEFGNDYKTFNLSLNDIDWEFFYSYISAKMKDMILEVRPVMLH